MAGDDVNVQFGAEVSGLLSGLKQAATAVAETIGEMTGALNSLKTTAEEAFAPLIAVYAAFEGFHGFKAAIDSTVELAKQLEVGSQKTGMAVEALSRLEYAANLSEVPIDQLTIGLQRLAKGMETAAQGGVGPVSQAFKELGVNVTDSSGHLLSMNDVLLELAGRFSQMQDGTAKTALAIDLFGRSGASLIPFLNRGKDGIAALEAEADRLGATMSGSDVAAALEYEDAMKRLSAVWDSAVRQVVIALMPVLEGLVRTFTALVHVVVATGYALMALADVASGDLAGAAIRANQAWETLKKTVTDFSAISPPMTGGGTGDAPAAIAKGLSAMEKWQLELDKLKTANAQFFGSQTQMELDFWKSKLSAVQQGSKDYLAIYEKITALTGQLDKQQYDAQLAALENQTELDKANLAQVVEDRQAELAFIRKHYDEMSKEVQDGIRKVNDAQAALTKFNADQWKSAFDAIPTAFNQAASGVGKSVTSMRQLFAQFYNDLLKMAITHSAATLRDHIATDLAKRGVTAAGVAERVALESWAALQSMAKSAYSALVNIGNYAAQAIAAAWASISAIPIVGPFLAPAIAVGAGAAVLALAGQVKSAAGGFDIPSGLNPITQLHAQEMVLPADLANRVRGMTGGGGGDVHVHVHAMDAKSVRDMFVNDHNDALSDGVVRAIKRGRLAAGLG